MDIQKIKLKEKIGYGFGDAASSMVERGTRVQNKMMSVIQRSFSMNSLVKAMLLFPSITGCRNRLFFRLKYRTAMMRSTIFSHIAPYIS